MTEAQTTKKKKAKDELTLEERIVQAYVDYRLNHASTPESVFAFCKAIEIKESDFYSAFNAFEQIEETFWKNQIHMVTTRLRDSEEWSSFSAREKMLAFYFSWFEQLLENRSFAIATFGDGMSMPLKSDPLKSLKREFENWVKEILLEGESQGEVAPRKLVSGRYPDLLWLQLVFLFQYWKRDRSKGFENTDAAIEKSVNLSFDLMGKGVIESFTDFARFFLKSQA